MYANTNFPIRARLPIKKNFSKDFQFSFSCFEKKNRNHVREKYVRSFINARKEIQMTVEIVFQKLQTKIYYFFPFMGNE